MITKMKKLTFLVYHKEYELFLQKIRELGVVHIVEKQLGEMDDDLQQFMLQNMYAWADKQPDETIYAEQSADVLTKEYEELQVRIQDLNQQLPAISKDIAQMEMWGDFDWQSVQRLEKAGLYVRFYTCPEKEFDEVWVKEHNAIIINEQGGVIFFMTVTSQAVELERESLRLPSLSLSELRQKQAKTESYTGEM